jgi:hypothetical protein
MIAPARTHWHRVYSWCTAGRPAAVCALSGGALALITFAIGLSNAVGVTPVIALALASVAITTAGLFNCLISDARTAWRRGFKLGSGMGAVGQRDGLPAVATATSTGAVTAQRPQRSADCSARIPRLRSPRHSPPGCRRCCRRRIGGACGVRSCRRSRATPGLQRCWPR